MATGTQTPTDRERICAIDAMLPHLATKADIDRLRADMIKWQIGTAIAIVSAIAGIVYASVHFFE